LRHGGSAWLGSTAATGECQQDRRDPCCRDHRRGSDTSVTALARSCFFDHAGLGRLDTWPLDRDRHRMSGVVAGIY
jgi:hypothetical protein